MDSLIKASSSSGFHKEGLINFNKIKNAELTLKEDSGFTTPSFLEKALNKFNKTNYIYTGLMTGEAIIPIEQTKGSTVLPVIQPHQLEKHFSKIDPKINQKLNFI